ncbi:uncharacterized protein LOC141716747 [Apium graveolens]|uniref:uncharacterized protein LOC141716747 n=1 Tax=Apium graveolens TaxID=4045 RepID=UPI003D7B239F
MNTYLQAALHNLKDVRTSLTIAERDRDRYLKASEANFTRFCEVEKELADEKEKVRKLELDAQRARAEVIAEYKTSQDFQDVLNAEYDANFPETFSSCWEQIVEEIGKKIPEVTFTAYPVPVIPGKEPLLEDSPVSPTLTTFAEAAAVSPRDADPVPVPPSTAADEGNIDDDFFKDL